MTIIPITFPGIDLKAFVEIFGQNVVNQIDVKKLSPTGKYEELLEKLIPQRMPQRHLYQSFYIVLPQTVETQFRNFKAYSKFEITVTSQNQFAFDAVMSGSFETWKDFISYLKADTFLIDIGYVFERYFDRFDTYKAIGV